MKARGWIIAGAAVLVLAVINPTMRDLKEAAPTDRELTQWESQGEQGVRIVWQAEEGRAYVRRWNFLVCSVYTIEYTLSYFREARVAKELEPTYSEGQLLRRRTYLGLGKNFFLVSVTGDVIPS